MTTYMYRITLDDGEMIAVSEALSRYRAMCEAELKSGPKAPYWAHLQSLDAVLRRLYSDTEMTSTSSPCWPNNDS
jgi:hypothetical protein